MSSDLKPGLQLGYWGPHKPTNHVERSQEAERLDFDSVWTAEAWGSDGSARITHPMRADILIFLGAEGPRGRRTSP